MSVSSNPNPPDDAGSFASGPNLIEWINAATDFPLARARSINRKSWSDEVSFRFNRRSHLETQTGGIRSFFKNPWIAPKGPLLDIACSTGHNLAYFGKRGIRPLYGVDISLPFLELAKKRLKYARVQQADMVALPFRSNYFRTIVARGAFHNTTTQGFLDAIMEIHRVLRDDGILFFRRKYRPASFDRYTRFALHTYLKLDDEGTPELVRNFLPPTQIRDLVESVGFSLLGSPPMKKVHRQKNENKWRYNIQCICVKKKKH